jgi:NAD(P)-dependent dehydrogenase (short-subunit alcohol dehydrogenase family)
MNNQIENRSSLNGKRVIILGGSTGIGFATAKAAAAEGAKVVIVSGNQSKINNALSQLPEGAEGYAVDLSREENIKSFFEQAGNFDHLVYTAAENLNLNNIDETNIEAARKFFNLRYWGAYAAVKYGTPFINEGGSVNLTGGTAGTRPAAGWSIASSICGAMEGLVRALAVELAPIRVNEVMPGVIDTNLWDSMPPEDKEGLYNWAKNTLLLGRVGHADDVALAFVYLMKQSFGTGLNLVVDGGTLLA